MKRGLLCFDLDGTLIDSRGDIAASVSFALVSLGANSVSKEKVTSMVGAGLLKTVEMAVNDSGFFIDVTKAKELTVDYYGKNPVVFTYMYEGVKEGLKKLYESGFVIALFSNKLQHLCEKILEILEIRDYFTYIIGALSGYEMKPNPQAVHFMLNNSNSPANHSYMIGDSDIDMETGYNAGIKLCLAAYGYGEAGRFKPDIIANSFDEFVGRILKI